MAKITREEHKVFGAAGSSSEFAQFGSEVAAAPVKSKDIATIQGLPAWDDGWQEAIYSGNKALLLEDLNAFCYEHSYQVGYILGIGVAEWDSATEYSVGSYVQRALAGVATGQVYLSLINGNIGNAPPASASNGNWLWVNPPTYVLGASGTLNKIPKISSTAPANGVPGSASMADSALTDDGSYVKTALPLKFPDNSIQATAAAPITTQSDVTGSRALGITYQNTGLKPLLVTIGVNTAGNSCAVYCDAAATPTTVVAGSGSVSSDGQSMTFIVLPGYYYKASGGNLITSWVEWA